MVVTCIYNSRNYDCGLDLPSILPHDVIYNSRNYDCGLDTEEQGRISESTTVEIMIVVQTGGQVFGKNLSTTVEIMIVV